MSKAFSHEKLESFWKRHCQFSSPVTMWRLIEALQRFFYVTVSLKQKEWLVFG